MDNVELKQSETVQPLVVPIEREFSSEQKLFTEFHDTLNTFIKKVANFEGSKKQLQKVFIEVLINPMHKEEPEFSYPEQTEIYNLGTSINSSKFFLLLLSMQKENKIAFVEPTVSAPAETNIEKEIV